MIRHSSTSAKKAHGRDGWMGTSAFPMVTGESCKGELRGTAPSLACSTSQCPHLAPCNICTLPELHLPLKGWCLHWGGTKSHPTPVYLWPCQENLHLPHSQGFSFPVSQCCPSRCSVKRWWAYCFLHVQLYQEWYSASVLSWLGEFWWWLIAEAPPCPPPALLHQLSCSSVALTSFSQPAALWTFLSLV